MTIVLVLTTPSIYESFNANVNLCYVHVAYHSDDVVFPGTSGETGIGEKLDVIEKGKMEVLYFASCTMTVVDAVAVFLEASVNKLIAVLNALPTCFYGLLMMNEVENVGLSASLVYVWRLASRNCWFLVYSSAWKKLYPLYK